MRQIDADALLSELEALNKEVDKEAAYTGDRSLSVTWDDAIQAIKSAPTIEPEQRWIPCSERLPKRGKDVLVTRDYDGREDFNKSCRYVEVAGCFGEDDDISWCSFSDEYKMKPKNHHVIAWMPLPEPYGGDQNG
jgi:hypothetical protein